MCSHVISTASEMTERLMAAVRQLRSLSGQPLGKRTSPAQSAELEPTGACSWSQDGCNFGAERQPARSSSLLTLHNGEGFLKCFLLVSAALESQPASEHGAKCCKSAVETAQDRFANKTCQAATAGDMRKRMHIWAPSCTVRVLHVRPLHQCTRCYACSMHAACMGMRSPLSPSA